MMHRVFANKIPRDGFLTRDDMRHKHHIRFNYGIFRDLVDHKSPNGIREASDLSYFSRYMALTEIRIISIIFCALSVSCAYNEGIRSSTWVEPPGRSEDIEHLFNAITPVPVWLCAVCISYSNTPCSLHQKAKRHPSSSARCCHSSARHFIGCCNEKTVCICLEYPRNQSSFVLVQPPKMHPKIKYTRSGPRPTACQHSLPSCIFLRDIKTS